MSQTGPWSVKGIDNRAREAAREAAREEGTTLGAYLNRLILEDDPAAPAQHAHDPIGDVTDRPTRSYSQQAQQSRQPARPSPADEPSTAALDRLTRRIESAEARSTLAITGIDQSVVGLLSRLENAEHNQQALGNHWDNVLGDVQKTYDVLTSKISSIEADESATKNQAALKSLEEALGKLAAHVYEENELVSEETDAIKMRVETGLGELTSRMDTVDERVEQKLHEASETVTKAVADSQMRVEGTNRHLAERFSGLEANLKTELNAVNDTTNELLSQTNELNQSLEGNRQSVEDIQGRLNRAEASTNEALEHLQSTFTSLDERLGGISQNASSEVADVAEEIRNQFDAKFNTLADDMRALIATTRAEMASEIEVAAKSVDGELIARLEDAISAMGVRLDASEDLQAQTMEMVGDTVTRVTESVDQRLVAGQNQQSRDIEQISAQVTRISDSIDQRFEDIGPDADIEAATSELRDDMVRFTNSMDARFEQLESRDTSSIDRISTEVEQLADKLNDRVEESEQRSATAIEQVGEQVANVAERLEHRQTQALQDFSDKLDATTQNHEARLSSALTNVSDRLERIQEQSITSISPVQKAIATLAQRIEAIEDFSAPPYIERDGKPDVPQMVSPVKIDTKIEDERPNFSVSEPFEVADTVAPVAAAAAAELQASPVITEDIADEIEATETVDDEPFEAGYKNWSESAVDLLDEEKLEQAEAEPAETVHDYFAELPPPMDTDEAILAASDEARDSDIFEDDALPSDDIEAAKIEAFDTAANPYTELEDQVAEATDFADTPDIDAPEEEAAAPDDFIAQARRAAVSAAEANAQPQQRPSKSRPEKSSKKSGGNGPAVAAGLGLLAVAGTAGYIMMNRDAGPEAVNLASTQATPAAATAATAASSDEAAGIDAAPTGLAAVSASINAEEDTADAALAADAETPLTPTVEAAVPTSATTSLAPEAEAPAAQISALTVSAIPAIESVSSYAADGNAIAQYQLGRSSIANGDITEGVKLIKTAEAQGLAAAQYELGNLHMSGVGVSKDPGAAIPLFKAAAEAGHVGAMYNYATLISETEGNEAEAANWYRSAAEFGLVEAQFNIATMYESGVGVSPSLTEALYWYQLAAASGDTEAEAIAADLLAKNEISAPAIAQIEQRAENWDAKSKNAIANGRFGAQPWSSVSTTQVLGIQQALNALNYDAGPTDGAMGATTRAAIRQFQADDGQPETGQVNNALIEALNIATTRARRSL